MQRSKGQYDDVLRGYEVVWRRVWQSFEMDRKNLGVSVVKFVNGCGKVKKWMWQSLLVVSKFRGEHDKVWTCVWQFGFGNGYCKVC